MNYMRRKCNLIVNLSKFTSNKKLFSGVGAKLCPFYYSRNLYNDVELTAMAFLE